MLDEKSVIPLYYQLQELLKETIKEQSWIEGEKVPSERELMETYKVSRSTVRKALDELMIEGLIFRKQGVGTFVAKSKVVQNLIGELSFNHQAIQQGLTPSSKVIHANVESSSSKRIRDLFHHKAGNKDKVHRIVRVRLVNKTPLILETLYIPYDHAPDILAQNLEDIAVFEYLEKDRNLEYTHSTLEIEPITINEFEAMHLEVEIGDSALRLERVIYSGGEAMAIQRRIMRGDKGKFFFTLGEDPEHNEDFSVGLEFNQ